MYVALQEHRAYTLIGSCSSCPSGILLREWEPDYRKKSGYLEILESLGRKGQPALPGLPEMPPRKGLRFA